MLDTAQCDTVEERPPCVEPGAADEQRHADATKISPIDFLKETFTHTSGPVYVCSLSNVKNDPEQTPERRVITRQPSDIRLFTSKWDRKGRALYFSVGALKQGAQARNKGTIAETAFLHADIAFKHVDGLPDDAAGKLAEVLHHLARLKFKCFVEAVANVAGCEDGEGREADAEDAANAQLDRLFGRIVADQIAVWLDHKRGGVRVSHAPDGAP
jgi:hypothetical protein